MAMSLKDFVAEHPVDRERVDAYKERMLAEVRAYRLHRIARRSGLTQAQLAERISVGQRQFSKIERGDLDSAKIGTIRSYLEAVGGDLAIEYVWVTSACRLLDSRCSASDETRSSLGSMSRYTRFHGLSIEFVPCPSGRARRNMRCVERVSPALA